MMKQELNLRPCDRYSSRFATGEIDILHVGYYMDMSQRASIAKIVENIMDNVPLNQAYIRVQRGTENDTKVAVEEINRLNPKVLHVHGTGQCDILPHLNKSIRIVVTVHDSNKYDYCSMANQVVCVHPVGWENNGKQGVVIANTVKKVEPRKISKFKAVATMRFDGRVCLTKETIGIYDSIGVMVDLVGYSETSSKELVESALQCQNVIPIRWNPYAEQAIADYALYVYWPPVNNPKLYHGLKVLEAVTAGVPVVTAKRDNSPIINGITGFECDSEAQFPILCREVLLNLGDYKSNALKLAEFQKNDMPKQYQEIYERYL